MESKSYKDSGVDIEAGEKCSRIAYRACLETHKNIEGRALRPKKLEGGFSGPAEIMDSLQGGMLVKNSDGVGSKALVAQRTDKHDTLAYDLIAMNVDDAAAMGAEPLLGTNTLDMANPNPSVVKQLMKGLVHACREAEIAMVGGEIADLPDQVKGYENPYIWNADVLGLLDKSKKIDGSSISAGQKIVAIKSNGIRSNGLTLARKICEENFGKDWHQRKFDGGKLWGEVLLKPSRICAPAILEMTGRWGEEKKVELSGIVHITGGGITNLNRVLPRGTGAELPDLFKTGAELQALQELGPVDDRESYRTWNMGQCMLIITQEPTKVRTVLRKFDLPAKVVGEVTSKEGIFVKSKGLGGEELRF